MFDPSAKQSNSQAAQQHYRADGGQTRYLVPRVIILALVFLALIFAVDFRVWIAAVALAVAVAVFLSVFCDRARDEHQVNVEATAG
jgi:uncharacterized membrane protein YecN with MAPEG domain